MSDFGTELERLMTARGVGVRQLARAVYVNPGHISNLRNGKARPSPELAADLDRYLAAGGVLEEATRRSAFARDRGDSRTSDATTDARYLPDIGPRPWELAETLTRSSLSTTAISFMEESVRTAVSSSTRRRQAWLAALSGRAHAAVTAQRGNSTESMGNVIRAIDDARGHLQAATPPSDTDFFDGPRLAGMAGTTMLLLGETRTAKTLIAEALAGRAVSDVKGRALLTLDLAECMAADREPEQAVDLAARAIEMTGAGIVRPVVTRVAAVHGALRPWSSTRAVLELGGQLADLKVTETEGGTCGGRCTDTGTSTPAIGYECPLMMSKSRKARDSNIMSCTSRAPL